MIDIELKHIFDFRDLLTESLQCTDQVTVHRSIGNSAARCINQTG